MVEPARADLRAYLHVHQYAFAVAAFHFAQACDRGTWSSSIRSRNTDGSVHHPGRDDVLGQPDSCFTAGLRLIPHDGIANRLGHGATDKRKERTGLWPAPRCAPSPLG